MFENGVFLLQLIILDVSSSMVKKHGFNLPPIGHYSWAIGSFSIIAILILESMSGWVLAAVFLVIGLVSKRVGFSDFFRMTFCIIALFGLKGFYLNGYVYIFLNVLFVFFLIVAEIFVYSKLGDC